MSWRVMPLLTGTTYSSSCTLLLRGPHCVVVDTGLSLQEDDLRSALRRLSIRADEVTLVVNTHLHIDHCGNNAIFPRARIVLSRAEWQWTDAFYTALFAAHDPERVAAAFYPELRSYEDLNARTIRNIARLAKRFWNRDRLGDERQFHWIEDDVLPEGLEVLATPGHTPHHISIRVGAAPDVVVAGDAVLNENALARVRTMIPHSHAEFVATRDRLLQLGVRIVPGHGPPFVPTRSAIDAP